MSLVKFSNQYPSLFDRFFDNDLFDWSNRNFSLTNTTLPSVNILEDENGVLKVSIPKKEEAKPRPMRQIEIQ